MLKNSWKNKPTGKRRIGAATIEFKLDDDFLADSGESEPDDTEAYTDEDLVDNEMEEADFYKDAAEDESDYFEDDESGYEEFSDEEDLELNDAEVYDDYSDRELADEETELYDETDDAGLYDEEYEDQDLELHDDDLEETADDEDEAAYDEEYDGYDDDEDLEYADDDDEDFEYADDEDDAAVADEDYMMSDDEMLVLEDLAPKVTRSKGHAAAAVAPVEVADYNEDDELSDLDFGFNGEFNTDFDDNYDISNELIADLENQNNEFMDEAPSTPPVKPTAKAVPAAKTVSAAPTTRVAASGTPRALPATTLTAPVKARPVVKPPSVGVSAGSEKAKQGLAETALADEVTEDIILDDFGFEDDASVEMMTEETGADEISFDEITFADDEYFDDVEDGMEPEDGEMLEDSEIFEDNDVFSEVEMLNEVLEDVEPVEALTPMEITLDAEALEPQEAEPPASKSISIGKTKIETTKDQVSEIQRQAEINQQRIAKVLSQTVKIAPLAPPPPPPNVQNRRQHNRIQASILVDYVGADDNGDSCQGMGVVIDISISGLQLQTPRELTGTHVKIYATDFNDNIMEIMGTVRQSRQKDNVYLNGISFESTENDTIKFITNLVRIFNARKYSTPSE